MRGDGLGGFQEPGIDWGRRRGACGPKGREDRFRAGGLRGIVGSPVDQHVQGAARRTGLQGCDWDLDALAICQVHVFHGMGRIAQAGRVSDLIDGVHDIGIDSRGRYRLRQMQVEQMTGGGLSRRRVDTLQHFRADGLGDGESGHQAADIRARLQGCMREEHDAQNGGGGQRGEGSAQGAAVRGGLEPAAAWSGGREIKSRLAAALLGSGPFQYLGPEAQGDFHIFPGRGLQQGEDAGKSIVVSAAVRVGGEMLLQRQSQRGCQRPFRIFRIDFLCPFEFHGLPSLPYYWRSDARRESRY